MGQGDLFARELPKQEGERWIDIEGCEGEYAVSNHGRVLSYKTGIMQGSTVDEGGHKAYRVRGGSPVLVHRLVLEHHGPPPPTEEHDIVNHIDGDPTNNHIDNLEWVTSRENRCHGGLSRMVERWGVKRVARRLRKWVPELVEELRGSGEKGAPRKLSDKDLSQIVKLRRRGDTVADIAQRYDVGQTTVIRRLEDYVERKGIQIVSEADRSNSLRRTFGTDG